MICKDKYIIFIRHFQCIKVFIFLSPSRLSFRFMSAFGSFGIKDMSFMSFCSIVFLCLSACLYAFTSAGFFSRYVITVPQGKVEAAYSLLTADTRLSSFVDTHRDSLHIVEGGASRQESVYKGLLTLADKNITCILVHDGARPWVSGEVITSVLMATEQYGAAVPAIPVTDTQKEVDETGKKRPARRCTNTARVPL